MASRDFTLLRTWFCIAALSACAPSEEADLEQAPGVASELVQRPSEDADDRPYWHLLDGLSGVTSFAVDRFLPTVLYASADGGRYISWSFGERWLRTSAEGGQLIADPNRPAAAFAAAGGKLDYTDNGGLTWREVGTVPERLLAVAPGDSDVLWAQQAIFLLKSTDRGQSWQPVPLAGPGSCCGAVIALSPQQLYASGAYSHLTRSDDGGTTWPLSTFADLYFVGTFAVDRRRPEVVYAGSPTSFPDLELSGLRKSTDGGRTWFAPDPRFARAQVGALALSSADGRLYMTASEVGVNRVTVFVSADGGASFAAAGTGLPGSSAPGVIPHPSLRCTAFAVAEGRLYRTTNAGGTCP